MDEWRMQQQHQHKMLSGGIGPTFGYQSLRTRSSPYPSPHQMSELKQSYSYAPTPSNAVSPSNVTNANSSSTPIPVVNDINETTSTSLDDMTSSNNNTDVYTPSSNNVSYTSGQMEAMQQQQHMSVKSAPGPMTSYNAGQQQIMAARARSMPYPMPGSTTGHHHHHHPHPSMYAPGNPPPCQCTQHMHSNHGHYPVHPSSHAMYYQHQQQQQQQQSEAWYRYQQQQAVWRHQMQQQQFQPQHPSSITDPNYTPVLPDNGSAAKLKATKAKVKKKGTAAASLPIDENSLKYQPTPVPIMPGRMPGSVSTQRIGMAPIPTMYQPSLYPPSNCTQPAQQLPPHSTGISQEHLMYTQKSPSTISHHQSQIFTSPLSNPGTPHQLHSNGEFNGSLEFGVPYHQVAPGSVNSLTDALCPTGDLTDRQMTPGPPSVGTPRVAPHQYSYPHTPLTPPTISSQSTTPHTPAMMPPTPNPLSAPSTPLTRPRSTSEQAQATNGTAVYQSYEQAKTMPNVDDLTAYLKDPNNVYLAGDITASFFDEIDALADTYLGQQATSQQNTNVENNSADDILLNLLCSDKVTN